MAKTDHSKHEGMLMNIILRVAIACISLVVASPLVAVEPPAGVLKRMEGSVLVNKGETYRSALEGMRLHVGDRIMIMDGASAVVVYSDGCVAEFKQNQIITLREQSTCDGGMAFTRNQSVLYAAPLGAGGTTYSSGGGLFGMSPAGTAGAFGAAGVIGAAALSSRSDNSFSAQ